MVRYGQQADALAPVLDSSRPLRVIDFGCGQGGLLRHLAERFPQHVYFGLEPCTTISKIGDITLVDDVAKLDGVFDLAIFSHVFEHLVDFSSVDTLIEHLAPNGSLYIEVPNPNAYGANPQREYLYYVDRLHVTHYSPKSLARLVERWDMNIAVYGEFAFPYKGGRAYPAQYAVASRTSTPARVADGTPTLDRFDAYLHDEARRFASLGETLASTDSVVVYGYGDNFHRARSAHGPLAGVEIKAIVDRRWEQLNRDSVGAHRFLSIEDAIREHSDTPFVVTVSWGGESIAEDIRSKTGGHVYLL
jgi:SAM-dependent methyltransferase